MTAKRVVTLCEGIFVNATGVPLIVSSQVSEEEEKKNEGKIEIDNSVCERNRDMVEAIKEEGILPEEQAGKVYIVPHAIARLHAHRNDLIFASLEGQFNSLYTFAEHNPCLITEPCPWATADDSCSLIK